VFLIVGHGVQIELRSRLERAAAAFFGRPEREKRRIAMSLGGAAWRGWFQVGDELTSGVPDGKEGIYFGIELPPDEPRVLSGRPLHGPNLFPNDPPDLRPAVLEWMDAVTRVGRAVLSGIARHLGLEPDWFDGWCADPTVLFRIFRYPVPDPGFTGEWGVAEHTDYGLLTLLAISDRVGPVAPDHGTVGQVPPETGTEGSGLEVRVGGEWIEVPAVADSFVCNLGDMLERMTNGRLRSTPHRVALPTRERLSFPLFLDPGWDVEIRPLPGFEARSSDDTRWDGTDLLADGVAQTYGDYLTAKVARVFPDLFDSAVGEFPQSP